MNCNLNYDYHCYNNDHYNYYMISIEMPFESSDEAVVDINRLERSPGEPIDDGMCVWECPLNPTSQDMSSSIHDLIETKRHEGLVVEPGINRLHVLDACCKLPQSAADALLCLSSVA